MSSICTLTSFNNLGVFILKCFKTNCVSLLTGPRTLGSVFEPCKFLKYDRAIADVTLSVSGFLCPTTYVFSIYIPSFF